MIGCFQFVLKVSQKIRLNLSLVFGTILSFYLFALNVVPSELTKLN
jgi:hypothetical protein